MRWKRRAAVTLLAAALMAGCGTPAGRWTEWEYIVPEGYEGFLVIRYECPGGVPLPRSGQRVTVTYGSDGVFCTSDSPEHTVGPALGVTTTAGRRIPYVTDPWGHRGWGVCCGSTQAIGGGTQENPGPDLTLDVQWVGVFKPRPRTEPEVPGSLELFWKCRFLWQSLEPKPRICP